MDGLKKQGLLMGIIVTKERQLFKDFISSLNTKGKVYRWFA
jgi:hypothetical protein